MAGRGRRAVLAAAASAAGLLACSLPYEDPSLVVDLRVLGIQMEPPELMAPACPTEVGTIPQELFLAFARPVTMTALLVDPQGAGRDIAWELFACSTVGDRTCERDTETVHVASGRTPAGVLSFTFRPGTLLLEDGTPLLLKVLERDDFRGLGGLRLPLVLHVGAEGEEVFAQKLMIFSCPYFPDMRPNVTPALPGLVMQEAGWPEDPPLQLSGRGPFRVHPEDFDALEEAYVVPSFDLSRVNLEESWKLSWYTDYGTFSSNQTGGTDLAGREGRHNVEWRLPEGARERDVTYWVVVRDGRGGLSWTIRKAHWAP
jgi:hypothetical protein